MKVYLVGGAVRDELLGLPVIERDWVVVGADAETLRKQGYVPADPDFPVFRHPQTGEEYALARREVKQGGGYRGFTIDASPDVTLLEDLQRRDLTINAMARDSRGEITDPFGGREDLDAGLLRHISPAFVEDPLRILRVARFAARFGSYGFRVAHGTHRLMCRMVEEGEVAHLTPERLWREMRRAMQTEQPWRFFEVLHRCGALAVLIPALAEAMGQAAGHDDHADSAPVEALKRVTSSTPDARTRLLVVLQFCVDSPDGADRLSGSLRADRETARSLRRLVAARPLCERAEQGDPVALYDLVALWRGFDRSGDAEELAVACAARSADSPLVSFLEVALPAARAVSLGDLHTGALTGPALGEALAEARRRAMGDALRAAGLIS